MRYLFSLILLLLAGLVQAQDLLVFNVTLDYDQERDHERNKAVFEDLTRHLERSLNQPVRLVMTQNAERVGERTRTASYDIILAPAHIIGLAMRHGYAPVAKTAQEAKVVLVAADAKAVPSLQAARGKRIALPHPESLVTYMLRGELNAMGVSPASYFARVMPMQRYGAVMYAMDIGQADVVATKASLAESWLSSRKGAQVIKTLAEVPEAGVAVKTTMDEGLRDRVSLAFQRLEPSLKHRLARLRMGEFEPAASVDFELVSTRGYYTPEVLPGATIVTAEQVKQLMAQGVPLFDVRPASHYRAGHIPGARNVTYTMNSPKEVDYDDSVDQFDLSKLPQDKNAPLIVQCNGAECWYSYKAARYLIKRGYKKVYWFRTGLPAWKAAGYAIEQSS